MSRRIEPGLLIIFRYYCAVAVAYFAAIITIPLSRGDFSVPLEHWAWLNMVLYGFLFGYLSWPWLHTKMGRWYLPVALMLSVAVPLLGNLFEYFAPSDRTFVILVLRSWLLFPILIVPSVLIAWQYGFKWVLVLIILSTIVDEILLLPAVSRWNMDTFIILGQPIIRAFSFGVLGHIVSHLLEIQRFQQRALLKANMEISKYSQTLEQLAVSRERNRIARELHDTLAHTLSALAVKMEAFKTTIDPAQPKLIDEVDQTLTVIRNGLGETRRVLKDLRPRALEELGLAAAIHNLAAAVAERANFKVTTQVEDIRTLAPAVEMNVYRIAQEALENVARHAGASEVNIRLNQTAHELTLLIEDNGAGIAQVEQAANGDGFGIQGMHERAVLLGGDLSITNREPGGTVIKLTLEI